MDMLFRCISLMVRMNVEFATQELNESRYSSGRQQPGINLFIKLKIKFS
jgi:hypothetical protein